MPLQGIETVITTQRVERPTISTAQGEQLRRWVIAAPGSRTLAVRLEDTGVISRQKEPAASIQQRLTYQLSERGLDLAAEFTIDASENPGGELALSLDRRLRIVSAQSDGIPLGWQVTLNEVTKEPQVILKFPEPLHSGKHFITLEAWGDLKLDQTWRLPLLGANHSQWSSGTTELVIPEIMELRQLLPIGCIQTATPLKDSESRQTRIRFQQYSPAAAIDLIVGYRKSVTNADVATSIDIRDAEIAGTLVADLTIDRGSQHTFSAELKRGWSVQELELSPVNALGEWYVKKKSDRPVLQIQLANGLSPSHPIQILIKGRLLGRENDEYLPLNAFEMIEFQDVQVSQHQLLIRGSEYYVLLPDRSLPSTFRGRISPLDVAFAGTLAEGLALDPRSVSPSAKIDLVRKQVAYEVDAGITASVSHRSFETTYRIVCRPQGTRTERMQLYFTQPLEQALHWRDAATGKSVRAQEVTDRSYWPRDLARQGELWELRLPRTLPSPFVLEATIFKQWPNQCSVPLVYAPGAIRQRSRVVIQSVSVSGIAMKEQGLTPVVLPNNQPSDPMRAVAAFEYSPEGVVNTDNLAMLAISPSGQPGSKDELSYVNWVDLTSVYAANGTSSHQAVLHMRHQADKSLRFRLPADCELRSVTVNGKQLPLSTSNDAEVRGTVSIPTKKSNDTIALQFTAVGPRLSSIASLHFPLVFNNSPILRGKWTFWLPRGFLAAGENIVGAEVEGNWRKPALRSARATRKSTYVLSSGCGLLATRKESSARPSAATNARTELARGDWQSSESSFIGYLILGRRTKDR